MIQSGHRIYCISFLIFVVCWLPNNTALVASAMSSSSSVEVELGVSATAACADSSDDGIEVGGVPVAAAVDWRKRPRNRAPKPLQDTGDFWA